MADAQAIGQSVRGTLSGGSDLQLGQSVATIVLFP